MHELVDIYLARYEALGRSPHTITLCRQVLGYFVSWLGTRRPTTGLIYQFLSAIRGDPPWYPDSVPQNRRRTRSADSVAKYARIIRSFTIWADKAGYMERPRFDMPSRPEPLPSVPTEAQVQEWFTQCVRKRDELIIRLFADTGARQGEVEALTEADIDGRKVHIRSGKGGRGRIVIVSEETATLLEQNKNGGGAVIRTLDNTACLGYGGYRSLFRTLSNITGVRMTPHSMRRYFATRMLAAGCPTKTLMKWMGWRSFSTISHYENLTVDDLVDAADRWAPYSNGNGNGTP